MAWRLCVFFVLGAGIGLLGGEIFNLIGLYSVNLAFERVILEEY